MSLSVVCGEVKVFEAALLDETHSSTSAASKRSTHKTTDTV